MNQVLVLVSRCLIKSTLRLYVDRMSTGLNVFSLFQRLKVITNVVRASPLLPLYTRTSSNLLGRGQRSIMGGGNDNRPSASSSLTHEETEALKIQTLEVSRVIVKETECRQLVDEWFRAGHPVGLDGEGVNLGPTG